MSHYSVIPAKAGVYFELFQKLKTQWIPAFAGMTAFKTVSNKLKTLAVFSVFLLVCQSALAELVAIPDLSARVTDLTQTLSSADKSQLEAKLSAFEQKKGSQIAVLIVPSTQPEDIAQYSIRVADAWKVGRKGVGDGVLVLIAKNDRKMRVEVGRGLEGAIPDAYAKRIVSDVIAPKFKQGDFAGGLNAGVDKIISLANGEALPAPSAKAHGFNIGDIGNLLPMLLFGAFISGLVLRSMFGTFPGSLFNGGLIGGILWFLGLSALLAGVLALVAFFITLMLGAQGLNGYQRGYTGGYGGGGFGGGFDGSSGGNVFSGGGGDFGGGGASGDW